MLSNLLKNPKSKNFLRTFTLKPWDEKDPRREWDKMLAGDMYHSMDPELCQLREDCRVLMEEYNFRTSIKDLKYRKEILDKILHKSCLNLYIEPPIYFDYGCNTTFGDNCYMNYGCTLLDVNTITIGDNCLFGPNSGVYTATHPTDTLSRISGAEYGLPIKIGNNCWIGGNAVICPGVTLGDNVVVASGAVVNKDVPSDCVVAGNPAKIIKRLTPFKYEKKA